MIQSYTTSQARYQDNDSGDSLNSDGFNGESANQGVVLAMPATSWLRSGIAFSGAIGVSLALFLLMSHLTKAPEPKTMAVSSSVSFLRMMIDSPVAELSDPQPETSPPPAVEPPPELPKPIVEPTLEAITAISSPKVETPKLDLPDITPAVSGDVLAGIQARVAQLESKQQVESRQQAQPASSPTATNLTATNRIASPSVSVGDLSIGQEVMVLHKVPAQYPRRAMQRRQEGWVKIRFDVTAQGRTTNLQVVEAKPQGMFDRAALQALQHWRFKPKQENGKAAMRYNLIQVIEFKL
ncbi:energy transducer TonB [Zooshikella ganghwensis]|uniref:Protein TonB n=1 Tax=Zooshikella ganghwensis TaxID=202772 RepID=A0A4P9VHY1_9GAMM|nr:energy transducer TonB [Zooshikella ganghwensis]RDH42733.1 energy transducer TonB [Zooshikella ganghwensis]